MLVDKHRVGLMCYGLDAALDGIVQPPRKVLGERDVAAVGDEPALRVAPGRAQFGACLFLVLAGDVAALAVGTYVGAPIARDLPGCILAREHVPVAVGPALDLSHSALVSLRHQLG